jgi:uncharacterized SAM-binding protein YcdF (DUF218 family)
MVKKIIILISIVIASAISALAFLIVHFSGVQCDKANSAIVLGAGLHNDVPSPVFQARIDYAIDLYKKGAIQYVYFTGGIGDTASISEAESAKIYALEKGVPSEAIYTEVTSRSTIENLSNVAIMIPQNEQPLIVSDPLHTYRAVLIAKSLDIDALPAPTPYTRYVTLKTQVPFLVREVYYTLKFILSGT